MTIEQKYRPALPSQSVKCRFSVVEYWKHAWWKYVGSVALCAVFFLLLSGQDGMPFVVFAILEGTAVLCVAVAFYLQVCAWKHAYVEVSDKMIRYQGAVYQGWHVHRNCVSNNWTEKERVYLIPLPVSVQKQSGHFVVTGNALRHDSYRERYLPRVRRNKDVSSVVIPMYFSGLDEALMAMAKNLEGDRHEGR